MADRLYRSRHDRIIGGVAGGIAENLAVDPTIVRIAWVVLALVAPITPLFYFILMFVVPEEPLAAASPGTPSGSASAASSPAAAAAAPSASSDRDARRTQRETRREARGADHTAHGSDRSGAVVVGILLVLVGGWFLVRQYLPRFDVGAYWPFVVIVLGAVLIVTALRPGGRSAD